MNPMLAIGYVLGTAMFLVGVAILSGLVELRNDVDPTLNTVFGIVILLFGIYRVVVTEAKRKAIARGER